MGPIIIGAVYDRFMTKILKNLRTKKNKKNGGCLGPPDSTDGRIWAPPIPLMGPWGPPTKFWCFFIVFLWICYSVLYRICYFYNKNNKFHSFFSSWHVATACKTIPVATATLRESIVPNISIRTHASAPFNSSRDSPFACAAGGRR